MMSRLFSMFGFGMPDEKAPANRERLTLPDFPAAIYAIGDVHGCFDQLRRLHDVILANGAAIPGEKLIVMLGDYMDRGPDSAATLDFLLTPPTGDFRRLCLAGNHEEMMLAHTRNPHSSRWLDFGGLETLQSYGIAPDVYRSAPARQRLSLIQRHIPRAHLDFLAALPVMIAAPGVVFTHAGIRPDVPLADQRDADLMWPIHDYDPAAYDGLPLIVHGHMAFLSPVVKRHRICVDTGCFATGVLTAVRLQQGKKPSLLNVGAR